MARLRLPGGVGEGVGFGVGVGVGVDVTGDVGAGVGAGVSAGVGFGVGFGVSEGVGEGVGLGVTKGVGEGVGDGVVVGSLDNAIVDVDCGVACGVGSGVGEVVVAGLSLDVDVVDVVSTVVVVADVPVGEDVAVTGTVDGGTTRVVVTSLGSTSAIQRQAQFSAATPLLSDSHVVASARIMHSNGIVLANKLLDLLAGVVRLELVTVAMRGVLEAIEVTSVVPPVPPVHVAALVTWKRVTTSDPAMPSVALLTTKQSGATTRNAATLLSEALSDAKSGATMSASPPSEPESSARASTTSFAPSSTPDTIGRFAGSMSSRKLPAPSTTTTDRVMLAVSVTLFGVPLCTMRIGHMPPDGTAMPPEHASVGSMQPLPSQNWHDDCEHASHERPS